MSAAPALVTGGAGFIGSHLVDALRASGRGVRVLDSLAGGKRENVAAGVELVEGDLRDEAAVARAVAGVSEVWHLAAVASVPRSIERPEETNAVNVGGTLGLLRLAGRAKVRRVVFASSSSVYGDSPETPKSEEMEPAPKSPYAVSKLAGEHYARMAAAHFGVETVSLRFFNVYGPRQDPSSPYAAVIPIFLERLAAGRPLPLHGDGGQTRDFTYVEDVVRGLKLAMEVPAASGRVYNIAGGTPTSVAALARELAAAAGRPAAFETQPARTGDVRDSWASVRRAGEDLGFRASVPLAEGLRRTWAWFAGRAGR